MISLKDIIDRTQFGTKLCIKEEFSENVVFDKTWEHFNHTNKLPKELLSAEATMLSVNNGKLVISIVK